MITLAMYRDFILPSTGKLFLVMGLVPHIMIPLAVPLKRTAVF
jgi:hypothetical protein